MNMRTLRMLIILRMMEKMRMKEMMMMKIMLGFRSRQLRGVLMISSFCWLGRIKRAMLLRKLVKEERRREK